MCSLYRQINVRSYPTQFAQTPSLRVAISLLNADALATVVPAGMVEELSTQVHVHVHFKGSLESVRYLNAPRIERCERD